MSSSETPTVEELQERFRQLETSELREQLAPVRRLQLTEEAVEATRLVLAERGESQESPVRLCMQCGERLDLESGRLSSNTNWLVELLEWFWFIPVWSWRVTAFVPDDKSKKRIVLTDLTTRHAGRCRHCGLIVFPGPVDDER